MVNIQTIKNGDVLINESINSKNSINQLSVAKPHAGSKLKGACIK